MTILFVVCCVHCLLFLLEVIVTLYCICIYIVWLLPCLFCCDGSFLLFHNPVKSYHCVLLIVLLWFCKDRSFARLILS